MFPRERIDPFREDVERRIGCVPRCIAYPLIFLASVVLWLLIAIAAARILRHFAL